MIGILRLRGWRVEIVRDEVLGSTMAVKSCARDGLLRGGIKLLR